MDIVNFPGIIAEHGLLNTSDLNLADDLLLIGKKMGKQRNGTQYENMAVTLQELANLIAIAGGNETLAQTLVLGNVTGGNNIVFSATDSALFNSGAFSGNLTRLALTGNHVWSLPDQSGTIALLSDIPGPEGLAATLGVSNATGGNNILVTAGDNISFADGIFAGVLDTLALTGNHFWNLPNQSGTIALLSDIPAAATTIYTGDGSTPGPRTVTLGGTLQFNHGVGGVNGYFQLVSGGYVFNQTQNPGQFFEYNHNTAILNLQADAASVTGYRATNTGGANPTSLVEMFAGSNSVAYINIGPTTDRLDFYANNTGKYAGGYSGGSGAFNGSWGFGTQPTTAAKVHILGENGQGSGTIIQSMNVSPAEYIVEVRDAANVARLSVSATGITYVNNRAFMGSNLGSIVSGASVVHKGADSSFLSTHTEYFDGSNNQLWIMMNNGNVGHNVAATSLDRYRINAGSNYDGAINIGATNLANNGYGILIQGGTSFSNYNGVWSDVTGGGTGIGRSFYGNSGISGYAQNYGGYFSARNGSTFSVGVFATANGGDAVTPSDFVAGLWASVGATEADDRRAGNFSIGQPGNINNTLNYGVKAELTWVSTVTNEQAWGLFSDCSVDGAGVVNIAAYLTAAGGGATNYALVTDDGRVVLGNPTASANNSLVEVYGDLEIIGDVDGIVVEDRTLATRHRIYLDNGVISLEAA